MGRGVRDRAGRRTGDNYPARSARGSDAKRWNSNEPEDDPLRDLRPLNEDPADPAGDEYVWPDMNDENEEDD